MSLISLMLRLTTLGLLGVQFSCTGVSTHLGREQSTTTMTTGGNLALAAVRATLVSAVRQPVTTTRLGLAVLWNRPREVFGANSLVDLNSESVAAEAPGTPAFEALLESKNFPSAESGSLKWLVDGPGFFPVLDRQIAAARKSIDIQVYIFDNDDIGVRYADALKKRSAEIPVHVLFDDFGSSYAAAVAPKTPGPHGFVPPTDMHTYLRKDSTVGARRILNPWLTSDHTKLFVFDQHSAILGGMNIGREYYSEWHDLMVLVEGPIVGSLSGEFRRAWRKAGPWGDLALLRKPKVIRRSAPLTHGIPLRILRTDPAEGRHEILEASLLAIRGARKRIWIENPYFGHDAIAMAVAAAARRGVDVRVIIPAAGDSGIMDAGNLATANGLIRAGARIYEYPKMTHLKVMICDDWATFGSANFDTLSMRINRELNLAFSDVPSVDELIRRVFQPDFRKSRRIRLAETMDHLNVLAEAVADQL